MIQVWGGNQEALRRHLLGLASKKGRLIVIVPEQYTLQTERELMEGLRLPGFFDLEVLSPSRLTERVFSLAGSDGRVRIDARGKQLALAKTLLKCRKSLKYYESAVEQQGFIQRIGKLITDLKQAGVLPETLSAFAETRKEAAEQDKMEDLALLYQEYNAQLAGQFVDGEDVQESMLLHLNDSGLFQDAGTVIYGFDVLTGQMNRLLLRLGHLGGDVQALIVLGPEEDFQPVRDSVRRLMEAAEEENLDCRFTQLPHMEDGRAPDLVHLTREYLHTPFRVYPGGVPGAIRLYAAPNPYAEAHFAAQEIVMLHEKGIGFGEIAVALGDMNFAGTLASVLKEYRIPAYIARKMPAAAHGASKFLLASLRAVAEGYPGEEMLSVIKSGYTPIREEDGWKLENYILSYGIRGKHWLSPFTRGSAQECAELEEARQAFFLPLHELHESLKEAQDAGDSLRAVYRYLESTHVFDRLSETQEKLLSQDMSSEAVQTRQVWEALIQLLSQAYSLLNGTKVSARHLASWLEAGLEACELSSLPPSADMVICGKIGNLPLSRPKALFLMNLTDGILTDGGSGLLTPKEQEEAQDEMRVHLSLDENGQDAMARLDIWKTLSAPSEHLFLTRSQATQEGAALRPFAYLARIRQIFPALVEEGGITQRSFIPRPLSPLPALDELGIKLREGNLKGEWLEAWKYLCQAPETQGMARKLKQAFEPDTNAPPLPREVTHALFMERVMSVSRLENFAVCPYKHFVEQGLSPKPRREWKLTPIDAGNFYHSALEGFTRLLPGIPKWPKIDKKTCDAVIDRAAEPLFQQMLSGVMGDSARMKAMGEKYRRVLRRVAWTFTKGARQCAFSTQDAEVKFGYPGGIPPVELMLKDGTKVFVRGIIDRIDRYAGDEGVYLRVVDYKSGSVKMDPAKIFWGAQLQLLLYLKAALASEPEAQPAGAFYMRVADPLLPDQEDTEQVEEALARALCLRGVAIKDAAILRRMDDGAPPLTLPKVITADGGFDKRAMLATLSELESLIRYAGEMAKKWAEHMREGEISAKPLCDKNLKGPCEMCDYAAICRQDVLRRPENARIMQEMRFDSLLEKINRPDSVN